MRVTGGVLRGRPLRLPPQTRTRPSSGKLKEALFSALGELVPGAAVADLFAGCGALGIEALSRGAHRCTFVELDARCVGAIRENLRALGIPPAAATIRRGDARRWLRKLQDGVLDETERPDLVLLDPPYDDAELGRLLPILAALVESGAVAACALEHSARAAVPAWIAGPAVQLTTRRHGLGAFTLLARGSP
jgi:16S rRNA (guanine966-N2)-methyltransferase